MFKNLKERLIMGWSLMRVIRLVLALVLFLQAWKSADWMFALLGGAIMLQTLLNVGCCGVSGCQTKPASKLSGKQGAAEIEFEEVK